MTHEINKLESGNNDLEQEIEKLKTLLEGEDNDSEDDDELMENKIEEEKKKIMQNIKTLEAQKTKEINDLKTNNSKQ